MEIGLRSHEHTYTLTPTHIVTASQSLFSMQYDAVRKNV